MGRIINETVRTTLADTDAVLVDNPTTGSAQILGSDLKTQLEIVARKGVAGGYAGLDSDNLVPAAHLRPAFTIEEVANAAARDALTVAAGDVGKRLVRLVDTGVIYLANATGTGSTRWTTFNSMAAASTSAPGVVELATEAEARTGTSETLATTPKAARAGAAILRSGLAGRQGLVFNGTAGAPISSLPAFGAHDFTVVLWLKQPTLAADQYLIGGSANSFGLKTQAAGTFAATKIDVADIATSSKAFVADKWTMVSYRRASNLGYYGVDAVEQASVADASNYTVASTRLGSAASTAFFNGALVPFIFNRALSTAELTALFEQGVPAAADYNTAGQTRSNATWQNGTTGLTSFASASGAAVSGTCAAFATAGSAIAAVGLGKRVRVTLTLTLNSGVAPSIYLAADKEQGPGTALSNTVALGAGANTVDLVSTSSSADTLVVSPNGASDFAVSGLAITDLGVVLAPEQKAAGNGYQWKDASGNKVDITLPVNGVAWVLPDRRPNSVRGTLTWSGTHEPKSLLGQRALPDGAVLTLITSKASAASSGSGKIIGSTNTATRWSNTATFTTAKKVDTLANQLPAGTADADNDIVVDPDSANITGSIEVEAHYVLTQSGV